MTDQPSYPAADDAPDQEYAEPTARTDSAAADSSDASAWSASVDRPDPGGPDLDEAGPAEPDAGAGTSAGSKAEEPTGVPEVDALLSVLDDLDVLPIEDHAQVFAETHQRLHQALLSADEE